MSIDLSSPVRMNLSDVDDSLVAEGWHTVEIERADAKINSSNNPMIFVMSRICDETDPDYNRTVIWNSTFDFNDPEQWSLKFVRRFFTALGMDLDLDFESYQALADELIGRQVDVSVKHKVNKQTKDPQANVSKWRPVTFEEL